MVKSMSMTFVAVVLVVETIFAISKLSGPGLVAAVHGKNFDLAHQWNCAHVIQNPTEVRRELVSRNLDGDHKVIKFIENCIKSVDGWRFKKADPSRTSSSMAGNSLATRLAAVALPVDRIVPYPVRLMLLNRLTKQNHELLDSAEQQQQESTRLSETDNSASLQPQPQLFLSQLSGSPQQQQQQSQEQSEQQYFSYAS